MAENDWDGWKLMTDRLGKRIQIVGDDLFVTNPKILKEGIKQGIDVARRILLKQVRFRFGEIPAWCEQRLQSASADQLEAWSERVLTAESIEDVLG